MNPMELFSSLEQNYRLPQGFLSRLYQIESSGGKNLYNPKSGASGPFQFIPSTAKAMGLQDPNDLAQSADAAARYAVQNREYLQRKGIENIDGPTLFLAHNQGADGAYRLLTNPEKPATEVVSKDAVLLNAGKEGQPAGEFVSKLKSMYGEGGESSGGAYSALGTSEPVGEKEFADSYAEDRRAARRESYALNTLMGLSKELQPKPVAMLPIPRLSYAKGGIVSLVDAAEEVRLGGMPHMAEGGKVKGYAKGGSVNALVEETAAHVEDMPLKQLAYLIRLASGMNVPPERATEFAKQIQSKDHKGLAERFKKYGNAKRTLMRLNAILGGEAHKGYAKGGFFEKDH